MIYKGKMHGIKIMQHNKIESSLNESSDKLTTYMSLAGGWGVSRRVRPPAPDPSR